LIRNLDAGLHARLKARAAAEGRSMKEAARRLLRDGLEAEPAFPEQTLGAAMRALFAPLGGVELPTDLREYGGGRRPTSPVPNGAHPTPRDRPRHQRI
jgi:plasmid stability protein